MTRIILIAAGSAARVLRGWLMRTTYIRLPDQTNVTPARLGLLNYSSGGQLMFLLQSRAWFLLPIAAAAGIILLVWFTRRLSLRAQFLVLLIMGVSISFVLLMIVQLPEYRPWLETLLVLIVFVASPIAVRIFLRGLTEEEGEQADEIHKH
jgi:hypothetical protein